MEKRSWIKLQLLLLVLIGLVGFMWCCGGCTSLYYYPQKKMFYDPDSLGYEFESNFLTVEGNERINYWYFPSESRKTRAVVIHFHGNAQNISTHFLNSAWLVRHDYDVMIFDYRGYGASDGSPSPENSYRDALAALAEAQRRADEFDVPIIILGQSLGGAIALRAIVDSPAKQKVALFVADSTFPSYRGIVRRKAESLLFFPLSSLVPFFFSNAKSPEDTIQEISPVPVLVMHSRGDPVVEYENGLALFQSLSAPRHFYEIPVAGHIAWSKHGRSVTDIELLKYLNAALQAYGDSSVNPFAQH